MIPPPLIAIVILFFSPFLDSIVSNSDSGSANTTTVVEQSVRSLLVKNFEYSLIFIFVFDV